MMGVRPRNGASPGSDPGTGRLKVGFLLLFFCAACGPSGGTQISQSGAGAFEPSLASADDGFAVAWYDTRDGNAEIYFRLLNATGEPAGPERRLTNSSELSYEADIQPAGMSFAVAWYEKSADNALQAKLGLWSREGQPLWSHTISSADRSGRNPIVRRHGNELMAVWVEDLPAAVANTKDRPWESEVWAGWWSMNGKPVRAPRMLAPAGKTTFNLNAAIDSRGWAWILFDAKAGTRSEELFLARTDGSGGEVAVLTADDGVPSKYPDVAFSGDRAAVTWYDERDGNQEVYLFAGRMADFVEERAFRVTETEGDSIGAYLAWNGRRIGLAWSDDSEGQHEVYFRPFNESGQPLARATRLTDNDTASLIPSIRASGTGFALAWTESMPAAEGAREGTGRSEIAFTVVR